MSLRLYQEAKEEIQMNNPIFDALNRNNNQNNIIQQFQRFRQEMNGKNPNEEIQKLLQSGRISQNELNQAQQMAQQMQGIFRNIK